MKINLTHYQQNAIDSIFKAVNSNNHKMRLVLSPGVGKNIIISGLIEQWINFNNNASILLLSETNTECVQFSQLTKGLFNSPDNETLEKPYVKYTLINTTYQNFERNSNINKTEYDLIICNDVRILNIKEHIKLFNSKKAYCIGIETDSNTTKNSFFNDAPVVFKYTIDDAIKDGYLMNYNDEIVIANVIAPMLEMLGFHIVQNENDAPASSRILPDIIAERENERLVIELKTYRDEFVTKSAILHAVKRFKEMRQRFYDKECKYGIIMLCNVDEVFKESLRNRNDIFLWDIKNILYLCNKNEKLFGQLGKTIPYPINSIEAVKPKDDFLSSIDEIETTTEDSSVGQTLIEELQHCKVGRDDASKFESICTEIIKYLFSNEFSQISEQNSTEDKMFRMDLLCSLKGETALWKFLMNFYNTKFVVFEYKNSGKKIPQNLVFVTEKYLFSAALRNVAFIISRKGFDKNAEQAYIGILKETGKFIISLTDDDLIKMIKMKEDSLEPSDYLLDKIEKILMSISK